jgi:hypothetical protein
LAILASLTTGNTVIALENLKTLATRKNSGALPYGG